MQEQRLTIRQEQKQVATQAQIQALHLLTLTTQELRDFISEQLLENPVLELTEAKEPAEEGDWQPAEGRETWETGAAGTIGAREESGAMEESGWPEAEASQTVYEDWGYGSGGGLLPEAVAEQGGLARQLLLQAAFLPIEGQVEQAVRAIIAALDSDGYLRVSLEELADGLNLAEAVLEQALGLVQTLEPRGVGARDVRECLSLQVPPEHPEGALLLRLIQDFLPDLVEGEYKAAAKTCGVREELVAQAYRLIQAMSPRPAADQSKGPVQYIVADVSVTVEDGRLLICLNDTLGSRLTLSRYYQELYAAPALDGELADYLRRQFASARMLIRNVARRQQTLAAIAEIVFSRQQDFFTLGAAGLRPLTLRQVAAAAELHESTVSRAVAGKYVETPRGLLPWKFFFPRGLETIGGGSISNARAKSLIAALISREDPAHPFSDQKLCEILQAQGLILSRRTVTKYRLALGLPARGGRRRKRSP